MTRRRLRALVAPAILVALAAACSEDLETGATCPALCPGQEVVVLDTVLTPAYVYDTTLTGFPFQGHENPLFLALRGDTLDVRVVVRFDTLVRKFTPVGDTLQPVTHVDSAYLSILVQKSILDIPSQFWIEAYEVSDPGLDDTARADLLPLFDPSRFLGEVELLNATFSDTIRVRVPLDSAMLRTIVQDTTRTLRIGLKLRSTESAQLTMIPYQTIGGGPFIDYRVSPDTNVAAVLGLQPSSNSPPTPDIFADDLIDFSVVADAPDYLEAGKFSVGGFPANRTYLRFDMPVWLTDSINLIRARLELTQDPLYGASDTDTLSLDVHLVLATDAVTDLHRAASLLTSAGIAAPSLRLVPSDSGPVEINMNTLVLNWRTVNGERELPSAIVLRTFGEGASPLAARFFSQAATDPSLRPRLKISYVPAFSFGRP